MNDVNSKLIKKLKSIANFDFKKSLALIGTESIMIISDRVEKGVSPNGSDFKKYSIAYSDLKEKSGRSTKPNLQFTGEMLNSMQYDVRDNSVVIDFPNRKHNKSNRTIEDIAEKNERDRPFFSITQKDLDNMAQKHVYDEFEKMLNGI